MGCRRSKAGPPGIRGATRCGSLGGARVRWSQSKCRIPGRVSRNVPARICSRPFRARPAPAAPVSDLQSRPSSCVRMGAIYAWSTVQLVRRSGSPLPTSPFSFARTAPSVYGRDGRPRRLCACVILRLPGQLARMISSWWNSFFGLRRWNSSGRRRTRKATHVKASTDKRKSQNEKGATMRIRSKLYLSAAAIALAGFLAGAPAQLSAQQAPPGVIIGATDLGGVVTGANGPEAGVWVIAETKDLPTRYAKIVVTDDQG